jgi:hypothetical protein
VAPRNLNNNNFVVNCADATGDEIVKVPGGTLGVVMFSVLVLMTQFWGS